MKTNIKNKIEYILKHNTTVQFLYKHVMSLSFRALGLINPIDDKLVLLNSFGGRKYNDSPKILFEAMLKDPKFKHYTFVWAFEEPEKFKIKGAKSIKIDSWEYFKTALKAKIWISSVNIERGLHFKKKDTIYINTWHGAGTKLIGNACSGRKDYDFSAVDMMLVQSRFESKIFERDFLCNPASIRIVGFPRNDELFHISEESKAEFRKRYNIPDGKKVILYAPTWRDSRDGGMSYEFIPPMNIEKWRRTFSEDYVMLFRMHTLTTKFKMHYDEFAIDVSDYDNLNPVLAVSDVVLTDYSTIVYDATVAHKPFVCFGFDYDRYRKERGFYYDLNKYYPGGVLTTEDEVIERIKEVVNGKDKDLFEAFRKKFVQTGGNATESVISELKTIL